MTAGPLLLDIEVRVLSLENFDIDIGNVGVNLTYNELVDLRNKCSKAIEAVCNERIKLAKEGKRL